MTVQTKIEEMREANLGDFITLVARLKGQARTLQTLLDTMDDPLISLNRDKLALCRTLGLEVEDMERSIRTLRETLTQNETLENLEESSC